MTCTVQVTSLQHEHSVTQQIFLISFGLESKCWFYKQDMFPNLLRDQESRKKSAQMFRMKMKNILLNRAKL